MIRYVDDVSLINSLGALPEVDVVGLRISLYSSFLVEAMYPKVNKLLFVGNQVIGRWYPLPMIGNARFVCFIGGRGTD